MMLDDYQPIDCARHSEYELAAMRGQWLDLRWQADGQWHHACLQPRDLETRDGAEYLLARDRQGQEYRIRLDRIHETRPCKENTP